jgi:hypothetical protein
MLMEIFDESDDDLTAVPETALAFLRSIYQSQALPLHIRMKAASLTLPYESPKLAVTAVIPGQDFAALLENRLKKIAETAKVIEARRSPTWTCRLSVGLGLRLPVNQGRRG